ncbi:TonB-dependent receptor [Saccharophagus degradans]|uniref:TonB-dependent receptor n=1 Tax=Saccharophagus degradans TaxID=86304 RepID=UPI001C0A5C30|nr:TonB-dependent receptor [Saccharophagus degradans]MBU2984429.1 TonB-dependent receptor [Saccharophagus degradans]
MGANSGLFNRKTLAAAVSTCLLASVGAEVVAQDQQMEEVVVTGIRASLQRSMDVKRDSSGVVDVITAEDIGKFPDTNLAESMQRISGVSISREGGEGSRVTVRGLGAEYNLVTHNGRTVARTTGDRSFNFAEIAAELIAGVAVSKTASADTDSGGMGATIDMRSIRPLAVGEQKAVVSGKYITDSSWAGGNTPEIFALYSNTFADDTIGVSVAFDYQERESSLARAMLDNGWKTFTDNNAQNDTHPNSGIYGKPQSARYKFEQDKRERFNGQLVVQWAPTDSIEATLDYDTYERSIYSDRNEVSAWFTYPQNTDTVMPIDGVWTTSNGVGTPLIYSETYVAPDAGITGSPNDLSMAGGHFAHKYSGDTLGLNVKWAVSDALNLEFDYSTSEASDAPDHELGSDVNLSTAAFTRTSTTVDTTGEIFNVINGGGDATANQMRVTGSVFQNNANDSNVDQFKFKGNFELNEESSIDFGVRSTEVTNRRRSVTVQQNGWSGLGAAGEMTAAFEGTDAYVQSRFDGAFSTFADASFLASGGNLPDGTSLSSATPMNHFFDWDLETVQQLAKENYNISNEIMGDCPDGTTSAFCSTKDYSLGSDNQTTETTNAIYVQYTYQLEDLEARVGVRHEATDVESTGLNVLYTGANWGADTEISFTGRTQSYVTYKADYSNTLPNIDISYNASEDLVLRSSWSKSIARPAYDQIGADVSVQGAFGRQVGYATGSQGNPGLVPYESNNLDVSIEWYYNDSSYFAASGFSKKVSNFIANETVILNGRYANEMPDIHDPFAGTYTQAAVTALGGAATGQQLRTYIFDNFDGEPGVTRDTTGGSTFAGDIIGQPADPLVEFRMSTPSNSGDDRELQGLELALQHMFGESGFGMQANYTMVNSDLDYDTSRPSTNQRPLLGVSDSANLVGFYDLNGWNVRMSYNWRDQYLSAYTDSGNQSPIFVDAYFQLDLGISYEVTDNLKVSLDGINITENAITYSARNSDQKFQHDEYGGRWMLGASYSF